MDILETPAKKSRKAKTTSAQYELYVNMVESNPHFKESIMSPENPNGLMNAWDELVRSLNTSGGPQKTQPEWKRVFTDWKCQVRKRARKIKNSSKETGNKGEPEKELSELEKKLLYLTGETVIEGIKGVPEIGLENNENITIALEMEEKEEKEGKLRKENIKTIKINNEKNVLGEINSSLKKLIELKEKEIKLKEENVEIRRLKLKMKYRILEVVDDNNGETEET